MKILILGVTGMLGHMAYRVFSQDHQVYATCRERYEDTTIIHPFVKKEFCFESVDILNPTVLDKVLQQLQPQVILNAIGVIKQKKESKDPIPSIKVNALFPHELAHLADNIGAKIIQISTDCVFSGREGFYNEEAPQDPVDIYGRTKLLGEVTRPPHLTLRTSFIGRQLRDNTSLLEWFLSQKNGHIKGFKYAIYSGLTSYALCQVIKQILERHFDLAGLYHVTSEPINKYELLTRLNQMMQLNIQIDCDTEFHCDRSLDGKKFAEATQIAIPSWETMLTQFVAEAPQYEIWRQ